MIFRSSIFLAFVFLCACQNMPRPYAPPAQRPLFDHFRPYRIGRIIDMAHSDANLHVVQDVLGDSGPWRWTGKHPEVRVKVHTNQHLDYMMDFTIVGDTFKVTGPVTLSFFVNGHLLDTKTYAAEGGQHFLKPVPADWIQTGQDNVLGAEIDKLWIAPADHKGLGFILQRIGLTQE